MTDRISKKYFDMLIQHSYSNEEKLGARADSVASKLEMIMPEIIKDHEVVERLKKLLSIVNFIKMSDGTILISFDKLENRHEFADSILKVFKSILENKNG